MPASLFSSIVYKCFFNIRIDLGMGNLCENLWIEILGRLTSEKDLVPCMSVSKLWHRITSDLWVGKFWAQSPPLGLFLRTAANTTVGNLKYHCMNYISLYNYHDIEDNLESTRVFVFGQPYYDIEDYRDQKMILQTFGREWHYPGYYDDDEDDGVLDDDYKPADRDQYLNGCNGLLLLLKSATHQFYVCNPITRQQVAIPKARVHKNHDDQHFCAALAFDPSESPHHYRIVRIDFSPEPASSASDSSSLIDIFSSEYGQWIRHRLQLDSSLTDGLKECKLCRQFFYLRGKLYSITMSWNLLCIDLKTVEASALELPIPVADRTGAMGCLGVSRDLLCYMKRMPDKSSRFHNLVVWSYEKGEWIPRYSVSCHLLGEGILDDLGYDYYDTMEPYAISPSSDLLFFGTPTLIYCIHLKSENMKFVGETSCKIDTPACFLTLRACFVPFHTQLRKGNHVSISL
ncbi:putative F-box domain-containing protein [Rosa chinensis]|uniref:Putative F-box domain-containing protein n=1 Tax=Rosa chinensis TaxID=74649 RepID=A0A2P6RMR8_ROSCH|nr:putative F-box domain-containing protein [Rosa chinensis]